MVLTASPVRRAQAEVGHEAAERQPGPDPLIYLERRPARAGWSKPRCARHSRAVSQGARRTFANEYVARCFHNITSGSGVTHPSHKQQKAESGSPWQRPEGAEGGGAARLGRPT